MPDCVSPSASAALTKLPVSTTAASTPMPPSSLPSNVMMTSCHLSMDKDALAASQGPRQMCRGDEASHSVFECPQQSLNGDSYDCEKHCSYRCHCLFA